MKPFHGLLYNYMKAKQFQYVIRGLRAVTDFEYEFQMAMINKKFNAGMRTVFLLPKQENLYTSSSVVRQVASLGGDVLPLVPSIVRDALQKKFAKPPKQNITQPWRTVARGTWVRGCEPDPALHYAATIDVVWGDRSINYQWWTAYGEGEALTLIDAQEEADALLKINGWVLGKEQF